MGGRRLTILGLVGALALLPGSAGAEAPTETLRAAAERVTEILGDPSLQAEARALERQAAVRGAGIDLLASAEEAPRPPRPATGGCWARRSGRNSSSSPAPCAPARPCPRSSSTRARREISAKSR